MTADAASYVAQAASRTERIKRDILLDLGKLLTEDRLRAIMIVQQPAEQLEEGKDYGAI